MEKDKDVVITKEQYKKINNYLNNVCLILSEDDSFYLNNIGTLSMLCNEIIKLLSEYNIKNENNEDCFTFLEIYEKAKEIIRKIEPKYLDDFSKIIDNGILTADYDRLEIPYNKRKRGYSFYTNKDNNIHINDSFNYDAIPTLIHEYFHKTNYSKYKVRYLLTEFISIYFELLTYEYLKNDVTIKEKLNLGDRICYLNEAANNIYDNSFYIFVFEKFGNIDDNTYELIKKYKIINPDNYTENMFKKDLLDRLDEVEILEKKYNDSDELKKEYNSFDVFFAEKFREYRYFIGILFAYYSLYNASKEKMLILNEKLKNNETASLDDALNLVGISLSDEFIENAIQSIKRYIEENKLDKKDEDVKKM